MEPSKNDKATYFVSQEIIVNRVGLTQDKRCKIDRMDNFLVLMKVGHRDFLIKMGKYLDLGTVFIIKIIAYPHTISRC